MPSAPELLRALRPPPNAQQELQRTLRELERTARVARINGNRYIQPREADLVPGQQNCKDARIAAATG